MGAVAIDIPGDDLLEGAPGDHEGAHAAGHGHTGGDCADDGHRPRDIEVAHDSHDDSHTEADGHGHGQGHGHGHGGHSHGSGSMNMRALVLHVMGDALGNVGVIATGLIIWLSSWSLKYYCDPVISLLITVIIFSSALPLVRSASFILLQGVPQTISLPDLHSSISDVKGVLAIHELHVWQLSESKIIASVHVWVSRKVDYMTVAAIIRKVLHEHGVHSSTIQPEFHADEENAHIDYFESPETSCLIPCSDGRVVCDPDNGCCPPTPGKTSPMLR